MPFSKTNKRDKELDIDALFGAALKNTPPMVDYYTDEEKAADKKRKEEKQAARKREEDRRIELEKKDNPYYSKSIANPSVGLVIDGNIEGAVRKIRKNTIMGK